MYLYIFSNVDNWLWDTKGALVAIKNMKNQSIKGFFLRQPWCTLEECKLIRRLTAVTNIVEHST